MVDLSVILPAYNEQDVIETSVRRLAAYLDDRGPSSGLWTTWEILVMDDGSRDETGLRARKAAGTGDRIRVHRLSANSGKGAAVRAGMEKTEGAFVIVTDVDLSYALDDIETMMGVLRGREPGPAPGMVTGDRRHPRSRMNLSLSALGHVMRRQVISAAFNSCARIFYGIPDRDTQCGLKGFQADAARLIASRLRTRGFLADIEMLIVARQAGLGIGRIPVHLTYLSSESTVHVLRQVPAVALDAIRIRWNLAMGRYRRAA